MRTLQEKHGSESFSVLAFPCNQFGAQEPGSNEEILAFAQSKFDVNFPMFEKIEVNGSNACDLYKQLTSAQPDEEGSTDIPWNFTKFLIGKDGAVLSRFAPQTTPEELDDVIAGLVAD